MDPRRSLDLMDPASAQSEIIDMGEAEHYPTGFEDLLSESPHRTIKNFVADRTPRYFSGWLDILLPWKELNIIKHVGK